LLSSLYYKTNDESVTQAAVAKEWAPSAVLLNCCAPYTVTTALSPLKAALHTCKALPPGTNTHNLKVLHSYFFFFFVSVG
jgi:hypothetical protein